MVRFVILCFENLLFKLYDKRKISGKAHNKRPGYG